MPESPLLIGILGPTGSGKTEIAELLADRYRAALINCDAFQVYRGMDIGTAKPAQKSRYELIDIKSPDENYGLGEFCKLASDSLKGHWDTRRNVVVVGGTGLYLRGLFEQYAELKGSPPEGLREELIRDLRDQGLTAMVERLLKLNPMAGQSTDLRNPVRVTRAIERELAPPSGITIELPPFTKLKLGLSVTTDDLWKRIENRVHSMVQNGWVKEVSSLLEQGYGPEDPGFRALGYTPIANALLNKTGLEEAIATTIVATRQYAKRQRTWLRSEPALVEINASGRLPFDDATGVIERIALGRLNG